ncbi:hypothetical protein GCM10009835_11430 [Planosporangium flavigriseum]|uniref:Uncharacterized protein n=1 Tax=Planosporangium flavigriseum TaxID=373681 RepID=A0A8J3LZY7_9ACTN|nr:hypothetical protein Pfl04_25790 [Planosporangium flavigriseum]
MLIKTTSCDAGVRVDLWCDSCDVLFSPGASTPQILSAVWAAAKARGWSTKGLGPAGRHFCPSCADPRGDERLVHVVPSTS